MHALFGKCPGRGTDVRWTYHARGCFVAPAAGYRANNSGSFANVTTNGYWWSASQSASTAQNSANLNINSGTVNPVNNTNRSNGFSVRCVAEFINA